ncbi:uncharacterized protein LOC112158326 isoform X2 [Oryzias melastigma]|uniref:uncharacterized protein LOC112158326 isoform X2 n=1 Tax=Oryzias melastigma TaxID=30732 RepID=UPI000CF7CC45|nr:uncharacterized protein LOC112158326 isoform X2 [Oryzias melastigma]
MFLFLGMVTIVILQFEGIIGREEYLYGRDGDNVILPCTSLRHWYYKLEWLFNRDANSELYVAEGEVDQRAAAASRLSVSRDGSLLIRNITAEDAGLYVCRLGSIQYSDVYLNILSISPSLPQEDDSVTLECSLNRHSHLISCEQNSIIWADETGNVLLGENVEYEYRGRKKCVSVLTVKRHSGNIFTCKFVEDNRVKIDAVYTPAFMDLPGHNPIIIIGTAVKVVLISLGVAAALLTYMKMRKNSCG